jgi:two-component system OmpR family sensor kinase
VIAWLLVCALAAAVIRLRCRLELVARAEHELRGPLTAFGLAVEAGRRGRVVDLESELARARTALDDLTAARRGRRAVPVARRLDVERLARSAAAAWGARVDWRAGRASALADEGRVAQALGNLLANAREHGDGETILRAEPAGGEVRLTVVNPAAAAAASRPGADRGRGLAIAAAAAREVGAALTLEPGDGEFAAALTLPTAVGEQLELAGAR